MPLTPDAAEALLGVTLHPQVAAWLSASAGERVLPGGLRIYGADAVPQQGLPLGPWTARFGEDFPALAVGSDGYGHELWVHAPSARVISVHHDSLDERLAGMSLPTDREAAAERVLGACAALTLDEVLALHRALGEAGDEPSDILHAICDALGWDMKVVAARLEAEAALAFLWIRVRDLLEGDGVGELVAARDTLAALAEGPAAFMRKRKLALARAGLRALPATVAEVQGLKAVDLSGNPRLDQGGAMTLLAALPKLEELSLADARLRALPEGLSALTRLRKLDLSNNPLAGLPEMPELSALQQVDLRGTPIDDPGMVEAFRAAHPDCVLLLARPVHPAGLGRAFADPARATLVDLSKHPFSDEGEVERLPALARLPELRVLRLAGQTKLSFADVMLAIEGTMLQELDLRHLNGVGDSPLEPLFEQPQLEVLRLVGRGWRKPSLQALLRYAAGHPSLRVLEVAHDHSFAGPMPPTRLEELSLHELREPWKDEADATPSLPSGFHAQEALHTLRLDGSSARLPEAVARMPALRELDVSCDLKNPELLSRCVGLEVLRVHDARLEGGFPDLRGLTRLRRLSLERARDAIPGLLPQLGALPALKALHLSGSSLGDAEGIWDAQGLERLELHFQHVVQTPKGLGALHALEHLDLQDVYPGAPEELRSPALRHLRWHGSEGPSQARLVAITENRALEVLRILDHGLGKLPESLARLTGLRELQLSTWRKLELDAQPDVFAALSQLEELELGGMTARRLPEGLLGLPLRKLRLSSIETLDWPAVLRQLAGVPTLRELEVTWAACEALPDEVGELTQLTTLMVHQCKLKRVSPEVAKLKGLQRLQLTVNPWGGAERRKLVKAMPWCQIVA